MAKKGRVIRDIESLEQAIKAEKDVESGYHGTIEENISFWMAVEEDIVESYTNLANNMSHPQVKKTLESIIQDSKRHRVLLENVSTTLKEIMRDEEKHAKMLESAMKLLKESSR